MRARLAHAQSFEVHYGFTSWSGGWVQRQLGVVGVPGDPGPRCRTWWVCGALPGRSLRPGNVYHSEELSRHPSGAGLTPGSASVICREYELKSFRSDELRPKWWLMLLMGLITFELLTSKNCHLFTFMSSQTRFTKAGQSYRHENG